MGVVLAEGWRRAVAAPGDPRPGDDAAWTPTPVPVLDGSDGALDHWFRWDGVLPGGAVLECRGLATGAEAYIDGILVAAHPTMFRPLWITVPPSGGAGLALCFRSVRPGRGLRRARWRNRLVAGEGLRTVRTSLLGRIAGTGLPCVGPHGPVVLHGPGPGVHRHRVSARIEDGCGVIRVRLEGAVGGLCGFVEAAGVTAPLVVDGEALAATLTVTDPVLWWPHGLGAQALIDVDAVIEGQRVGLGRTGFRTVARADGHGFGLVVNGRPVFCRGALWMGGGVGALIAARDAGLMMVRVPGFTRYPGPSFHDACDRLGLLVWQDFMFTRFDYPDDAEFLAEVRAEADSLLAETQRHPSLAVLCGGDEVVQAAAMGGRPASEWRHPVFDSVLPAAVRSMRPDVPYVANAPDGGALPFGKSAEIAHYFGVGAYRRPVADAAGVRFAAACLAFANPPDAEGCRGLPAAGGAGWAALVPRDAGAEWDFEDVRDHYVAASFGVDAAVVRREAPDRWLALGRAAVALAIQGAMARWRSDPACGGALVLALQDVAPGPGWGLIAHDGRAKSALHALASVSRAVQVLLVDGGLDGVAVHLLNETASPRTVRLLFRGLSGAGVVEVLADDRRTLPAFGRERVEAVTLMGRFQDLAGAWGFGPKPFVVLGAALFEGDALLSEATLFPCGAGLPMEDPGLRAAREHDGSVRVGAAGFAQFVTIDDVHCTPFEDHFHLWPGEERRIALRPVSGGSDGGLVRALNSVATAAYGAAG